jgi:predicted phosphodiesterase
VSDTRTYTNKDGMEITVDVEHLEKAVEVKLALQDKSPSRRVSWAEHKKVMEEEGYFDSDTSEAYRCLVKDYQKKVGKLHSLPKHAELVHTSKLDAIKRMVGDFRFEKQANQDILREINKYNREFSRTAVMVDEFRNVLLDDIDFSVPHYIYEPKKSEGKNVGIVIITDWHIGVMVNNCLGNYYNYEIAQKRVDKLKHEVLEYCKLYNISELKIIGLGDWVEHISMRKNQSQDCEFGLSMQIAKAQKLIFNFIVSMAEYANVSYSGIAGNHDRMNGDKTANFDGDNANVVINEGLKEMISLLKSDRITFIHTDIHDDNIKMEVNGKLFKFTHGDNDGGKKNYLLKSHIVLDKEFYDVWIHGHLHNYYVQEEDYGRIIIGVGCLMGRNNYAKHLQCATNASQAMIVVREDGRITPLKIDVQEV